MTATGHISDAPASTRPTRRLRYFQQRPRLRRFVYVAGYEGLSVLCTVLVLNGLLGHGGGQSTFTAILLSTTATVWNYIWNTIFESLERRVGTEGRGPAARAIHAIGYEGGALLFTVPIVTIVLGVTLLEAVVIEASMLVFFLVFTVVYAWAFDRVFGLPASALGGEAA
ncbi:MULTISPECIES: PACE efflux transporter [unclassified Leucobacter]|uniref:PACE efflux transporter n=1 Tax=unclassified Leucobacter TaxID=2621730 RepID=UPI0013045B7B|nr:MULTISPECIES: PACE efflux transporter [unclassified Leucobacter]